jgi:hypothetical protein
MEMVRLIHWHEGEAEERADRLRRLGYAVEYGIVNGAVLKELRARPPQVFVIDLSRLPSQGREVAVALRLSKATRLVPLVFVDGTTEKVGRIRLLLPDAAYTTWDKIALALKKAIASPLKAPIIPPSQMSAYAASPLPVKLGVKAQVKIALLNAPKGFRKELGTLPTGSAKRDTLRAKSDLILWFVTSQAAYEKRLRSVIKAMTAKGMLWVIWPKKRSRFATDVSELTVRGFGLQNGLVDSKICRIDDTWAGLRFTIRGPL